MKDVVIERTNDESKF